MADNVSALVGLGGGLGGGLAVRALVATRGDLSLLDPAAAEASSGPIDIGARVGTAQRITATISGGSPDFQVTLNTSDDGGYWVQEASTLSSLQTYIVLPIARRFVRAHLAVSGGSVGLLIEPA